MLVGTLKAQRRLVQEYGLNEREAEGIVEAMSSTEDRVATKSDLHDLRGDLQQDMQLLRRDLTTKIYVAGFSVVSILAALNFFT